MQYLDLFLSEYGWSAEHVINELPYALAQHLSHTIAERKGPGTGNGYVDREVNKAVRAMKQYLEEHYTITD